MREFSLNELQALAYRARMEGLRCATVAPSLSPYYLQLCEVADALHALELRDRGSDPKEEAVVRKEVEPEGEDAEIEEETVQEEAPRFSVKAKGKRCEICGSAMWCRGSQWHCDEGHEIDTSDPGY